MAQASMGGLILLRTVADLRRTVRAWRREGDTLGLVPTMGALHDGHLALVAAARAQCSRVVATIFVNPKQFERADDLAAYPRGEAEDARKLDGAHADALFAPDGAEVYPDGFASTVSVRGVSEDLDGAARPGHFDGVATVVTKLLLQSLPDAAFFGEKDYQQLLVVRRLQRDLDIPVEIVGVPTVREPDGLAMSSRNAYLTTGERLQAPALHRCLQRVAERLRAGQPPGVAVADAERELAAAGFGKVDYVTARNARTLAPLTEPDEPARVLGAAWLGRARLIDNVAA